MRGSLTGSLGASDDERRFRQLYISSYSAVYAYAMRRLLGDRDSVEDVVAEVFAVTWNKLGEVPDPPYDRCWLFAVANKVVLRQKRSSYRRSQAMERARRQSVKLDLVDWPHGLDEPVVDFQQVRTAMAGLPPVDAEVLRLLHWEEMSTADVARMMGVTPNAVSIRAHRAKKKLRTWLGLPQEVPGGLAGFPETSPAFGDGT